MKSTVDKFEKIMNEAISDAENLPCELIDFYKGLIAMKGILDMRLEVGQDECPEAFED